MVYIIVLIVGAGLGLYLSTTVVGQKLIGWLATADKLGQ